MKNQPIGTGLRSFFLVIALAFHANTTSASSRAISYAGHSLEELRTMFSDTEKKYAGTNDPNVRFSLVNANVGQITAIEQLGDRAALPFLEEKSLETSISSRVRENAAAAYVKIANVEEGVDFLQKYCADPTVKSGKWLLVQQYLDKYGEHGKNGVSEAVGTHVLSVLLTIMQTTDVRDVANRINQCLLRSIPQYTNSAQRASLVRFATSENEWVTNTFHPVKAYFDKIPPSKRVDLRKRFPDLPPLPEDKNAGTPLKTSLAIGAALAALVTFCVALGIRARKPQTREKE
jgi:hypothetical protein